MYSTKDVGLITQQVISSQISEFEIFKFYIFGLERLDKKFKSELRKDPLPSCVVFISSRGGYLYYDFGEKTTLTCYQYVANKFGCTYQEALNIIAADFKLTSKLPYIAKPSPSLNYVGLPDIPKEAAKLPIKRREWNSQDTYWNEYGISLETLEKYRVIPLQHIWIEKPSGLVLMYSYTPEDPAYSYEHGRGLRKILRPYNKEFKWTSNLLRNSISGYENLDKTKDTVVITKSLKDVMIYHQAGINAVSPQSETSRLPKGFIDLLKSQYENIFINFDPDKAGMEAMLEIEENYGLPWFVIDTAKDISDHTKLNGFDASEIQNFLPKKL
jgi:hypothetical protein